jgi:hypothetical protein
MMQVGVFHLWVVGVVTRHNVILLVYLDVTYVILSLVRLCLTTLLLVILFRAVDVVAMLVLTLRVNFVYKLVAVVVLWQLVVVFVQL